MLKSPANQRLPGDFFTFIPIYSSLSPRKNTIPAKAARPGTIVALTGFNFRKLDPSMPRKIHYLLLLLLMLCSGQPLSAQDSLTYFLSPEVAAGTHQFYVPLADDEGREARVPIAVIKGRTAGPVITLVAGVHGYEYPPIVAAQELIGELSAGQLRGTVIILPMLNPAAFYGRSPFLNPQDQKNLNRIFPGDLKGSITEQIAAYVTHTVIPQSDVVVDIHGGDANEDLLPFVCYYDNPKRERATQLAKQLSEHSGFQYVVSYAYTLNDSDPAKYLFKQAVQDGKVGVSIECGKLGNLQPEAVTAIKTGVYGMLESLEMYQAESREQPELVRLTRQTYLRSPAQGIFRSQYTAGETVQKGAVVGQIVDAFGQEIAEIVASETGVILYKIGTPPVNEGETIMCLGQQ